LPREHRKLAAILFADVVGSSRLMGRDESGTVARLLEHLMVAADRGLEVALAVFPLAARAEIMERVQATPAPFWKPDEFWVGWADEVRRVLPAEGMPESCYGLYDEPDAAHPEHPPLSYSS
jgi:hypothetical protein